MSLRKWHDFKVDPSGADLFVLAMACWKLDQKEAARSWYARALARMEKNQPHHAELRRFRAEAAEVLGVKTGP